MYEWKWVSHMLLDDQGSSKQNTISWGLLGSHAKINLRTPELKLHKPETHWDIVLPMLFQVLLGLVPENILIGPTSSSVLVLLKNQSALTIDQSRSLYVSVRPGTALYWATNFGRARRPKTDCVGSRVGRGTTVSCVLLVQGSTTSPLVLRTIFFGAMRKKEWVQIVPPDGKNLRKKTI